MPPSDARPAARVVSSGHGGDHWLDADSVVLAEVLRCGQLALAWNFAAGFGAGGTRSTLQALLHLGLAPHKPDWLRNPVARRAAWVIGPARAAALLDERRIPGLLPRQYRRRSAQLADESAAGGYEAMTRLVFDRVAARGGVEIRHPYLDRRLMEFACRVPAAARSEPGRNRMLQRDALADLLPPTVAERGTKASLSDVWWREIVRHVPRDRLESSEPVRAGWVDRLGRPAAGRIWRHGEDPAGNRERDRRRQPDRHVGPRSDRRTPARS